MQQITTFSFERLIFYLLLSFLFFHQPFHYIGRINDKEPQLGQPRFSVFLPYSSTKLGEGKRKHGE